jgi:hypothetical protein
MRFLVLVCARVDEGLAKIAELINHWRRLIMIQCFYHKADCKELSDQVRAVGAIKDNTWDCFVVGLVELGESLK